MSTYKELLQQREALESKIAEARQREISQAVSQARALVAEFGLTAQDVFPTGKTRAAAKPGPAVARRQNGSMVRIGPSFSLADQTSVFPRYGS